MTQVFSVVQTAAGGGGIVVTSVATPVDLQGVLAPADGQICNVQIPPSPWIYSASSGAGFDSDGATLERPGAVALGSNGRWYNTAASPTVATIAALRLAKAGVHQRVRVLAYSKLGDGGGGEFYWDATSVDADNLGTTIQPSGVATGRWKRQYTGSPSVAWFGAKFDCRSSQVLALTAGSNKISAPPGLFSAADVGKGIVHANLNQLTGTVTISIGSAVVVGAGTSFVAQLADATRLAITGIGVFGIVTVTDNTHVTVDTVQGSNTGGLVAYGDLPTLSTIAAYNAGDGSINTAASTALYPFPLANVFATWGTDDTSAFVACDAAIPQGIAMTMPLGDSMLPSGLSFSNARALLGSGMRIANNNVVGSDNWYLVDSSARGTVLRMPGAVGIKVTGALYIGLDLRNFTLVGSGHFGASGLDTSTSATAEFDKIRNVQIANFANGARLTNSLETYGYGLFVTGCRKGITAVNVLCNDLHVYGGSVQQCDIGVATAGMSSCHFHGMVFQNNKQRAVLWGQCDQTWFHGCWYEGNTASWGIDVVAGSLVNSGYEKCRSGDTFVQPLPVSVGAGIAGFTFNDCLFSGTTLNLGSQTAPKGDNSTFAGLDLTTPPNGIHFTNCDFGTGGRIDYVADNIVSSYIYAATVTPDLKRGKVCSVLMTGNLIFANPINLVPGSFLTLIAQQDGVGGRTVTLGANYKGAWTPNLAANGFASKSFYVQDALTMVPL